MEPEDDPCQHLTHRGAVNAPIPPFPHVPLVNGKSEAREKLRPSRSWGSPTTVGNATRPRPSPSGGSLRRSAWLRSTKPSRLSFNAASMIAPVRSVYGFGVSSPATTNTMLSPATSINCASSEAALIDYGVTSWYAAVNAQGRSGRSLPRSWNGGFHHPAFCTLILTPAFTSPILHKSRMRRRARTALCGGRSAMIVLTATRTRKWTSVDRPASTVAFVV